MPYDMTVGDVPAGAEEQLSPEQAAAERRIEALMQDARYRDPNHPEHAQTVAEVTKLFAARHPEAEGAAPAVPFPDADVGDLRRYAGVEQPQLPPQIEAEWSPDMESDFLRWGISENLPKSTLQAIYDWYLDKASTFALEEPETEQEFRQVAHRHGLSKPQTDKLIAWHRESLAVYEAPARRAAGRSS
jgi:hypothetical protein